MQGVNTKIMMELLMMYVVALRVLRAFTPATVVPTTKGLFDACLLVQASKWDD